MTDLQLSLAALGAAIILAVVLFNWWQERRLRKQISARFDEPRRDALMGEFNMDAEAILRNEPVQPQHEVPVVAATVQPSEPFPPTIPIVDLANFNYESPVAEAISTLAEFEQDMAASQPDLEQPVPAISRYVSSWEEDPADKPAAASTEELMQEAGLDEIYSDNNDHAAVTSIGSEWSANPDSSTPAAPVRSSVSPRISHTEHTQALPADISQQIDLIALLYLPKTLTGAVLRKSLLTLADLDKPMYAFGLGLDHAWHLLTLEQEHVEFSRIVCSLQLADRSGQISSKSLTRFQHAVDNCGHKLGAQVEWLGNADPFNYAAELDQFCLDVDKMVGFHLIQSTNGPFTGTKFRGLAEASGLILREDGAFHYESETGQRLFSVVNQENYSFSTEMLRTAVIRGLTFQLDIPRVKNCAEVFNHMVLAARQMENSLAGLLVDDNQRPLGEIQIEKIRQQLKMIHVNMVTRGIAPGSALALRLFS